MGIVLLVDARRDEVSDLDRDVATWVLSQDIPLLVAITKSDLIPKARLLPQTRVIEDKLGIPEGSAVVCSSKTRQGRDDLLTQLFELVSEA
jgi:GTP-binding protein EngB required for normal cell division